MGVMKKFEKAKELVVKAEATHKRTESYASDMRERLEAIQKEVHAGRDQVRAITKKEAAAKKRVVAAHATVKKAKIEVKALEQDEEARADRKGQEIKAKALETAAETKKKAEEDIEEAKVEAEKVAEETKGEAGKEIARSEKEAMNIISKRAESMGREETTIKAQVADVTAKEVLEKKLCKKNVAVLTLKKKVIEAELEPKYKDAPESLIKQKTKIDSMLATENAKLASSEKLSKNYKTKEAEEKKRIAIDKEKSAAVKEALGGADLVNKNELSELETEAKGYKADHKALGVDEKQLTRYRKQLRKLEIERDNATKLADKSFWHEKKTKKSMKEKLEKEKFKAIAGAAQSKNMLLLLHKTLTERKNSLEKDILRLRTMAALNKDSKNELFVEWKKLLIQEAHLKKEIKVLDDVSYKTKVLHDEFVNRIKKIRSYGGKAWLKKHNIRTAIAKFRSDVVALGSYTDRVTKTSNEESEANVVANMLNMDKRRQEVLDDIAKQSARSAHEIIEDQLRIDKKTVQNIKSPAEMVKVYEQLQAKKHQLNAEVVALKAHAPTFDDLVAGEFHAVSQYTDRGAVTRMMRRLQNQLKRVMNATATEKKTSVLQVAHAAARLYAHQIAHATHEKYLDFKLGRLDTKMAGVKSDIRRLKAKQALPAAPAAGANAYDHLLDDEPKEKTGAAASEFTVSHSWLNPEPIATPVEVTHEMRSDFKNALKTEFKQIAGGGEETTVLDSAREQDKEDDALVMLDEDTR